jgi:adenylylsulfate kinase
MYIETRKRSLLKAISWRLIASLVTTAIAFIFGLPTKVLGLVFFTDLIVKFILYFIHERFWHSKIKYGIKAKED